MQPATNDRPDEKRAQLLVIDDDNLQRMIVQEVARKIGYEVTGAASYDEAAELLGQSDYDCITLDISLGRRSGIEILRLFKEVRCTTPIIVISGSHESIAKMAVGVGTLAKLNMCKPIPKPVNLKFLSDALTRIKQQSEKPTQTITLAGWTSEAAQDSKAP